MANKKAPNRALSGEQLAKATARMILTVTTSESGHSAQLPDGQTNHQS
jgi:hypothetical protein